MDLLTNPICFFRPLLGYLEQEAAVVGLVCAVFLVLFVVAGIKQMLDRRE